jgi:uncharacterized phage-associated protein
MQLRFNETKATQAAARLLKLRGGQMSYMKLIKLLYIVDREALLRWGRPVTTDRYVSMDRGPVLSRTLSLITDGPLPGEASPWAEFISEPKDYGVRLRKPAPQGELSDAEIALIDEVFTKYGKLDRWKLVELVHSLPEWQDPNGSAIPIGYEDILRAGGKSPLETQSILDELENLAVADSELVPG